MRDFVNNGDMVVNGGIEITDNSNHSALLINCTNDELIEERTHRENLLDEERSEKNGRIMKAFLILLTIAVSGSVWLLFIGKPDFAAVPPAIIGLIFGYATLEATQNPSEFEQRQLNALAEIGMILRERRVG